MLLRPTVSVVLPIYNHAHYLSGALEAIRSQKVSPVEVIIIDDGSTDETPRVIREFEARYPEIRSHRNPSNRGVVYSLNRGAELARGEFIYFTSADDRILPAFLERATGLLAQHRYARILCTDQNLISDRFETPSPKHVSVSAEPAFLDPAALVRSLSRTNDSMGSSGTLIHRETLAEMGGFSPQLRWHSDWFLTLAIGFRHGLCYLPEPLTVFRLASGSHSSSAKSWALQRPVLEHLLECLELPEYQDVAPAFFASGVLSNFGMDIVRTLLASPERRHLLRKLPFGKILWREVRNLLIWLGPERLRRSFWALRYRLST